MSGILKKIALYIKSHKKRAVFTGAFLLMILGVTGALNHNSWLAGICAVIFLWGVINTAAWKKGRKGIEYFSPSCKTRNIDCLVIGDMCRPDEIVSEGKSYLCISAPGRSLKSSFEILRHTFSILREDAGETIITVRKENIEKGFHLFDMAFLGMSPISVKRLHLEGLKKKEILPLLFAPAASIQILLGCNRRFSSEMDFVPAEMERFCKERNICLRILVE